MVPVQAYVSSDEEGCYCSERMFYEVKSLKDLIKIRDNLKQSNPDTATVLFEILDEEV